MANRDMKLDVLIRLRDQMTGGLRKMEGSLEQLPKSVKRFSEVALGGLVMAGKLGSFELKDMAKEFPSLTSQVAKLGLEGRDAVNFLGSALQIAMKGAAMPTVAAHYFPGKDFAAYDDMGLHQARFVFDGLYVGDDYITHGKRLKTAFERPDPGTLIHPWFGALTVILIEPAEIAFVADELRVVRIGAEFELVDTVRRPRLATGANLAHSAQAMLTAGQALCDAVDLKVMSRLKADSAGRVATFYMDFFAGLAEPLGARVRAVLPALLPSSTGTLALMTRAVTEKLLEIGGEATTHAAVAPAAGTPPVLSGLHPQDVFVATMAADRHMRDLENDGFVSGADEALSLFIRGGLLASTALVTLEIDFVSRTQAINVRSQITGTLNGFLNALQTPAHGMDKSDLTGEAAALYRAAQDVKLWVIADLNEIIGRLPMTKRMSLAQDTDAFVLANHLYGDDVSAIEAGYSDIITRNRLRHPALIEAGYVEILA